MMGRFLVFLKIFALCCLSSCSCGKKKIVLRIAIDPAWTSLNLGSKQDHVNGFMNDLLLEISGFSRMEFECVQVDSEALLTGLKERRYEAILSSLPRTNYYLADYDFSKALLETGPVLVLSQHSDFKGLEAMGSEIVGVLSEEGPALVLQAYPEVVTRTYSSAIELLDAVTTGEIGGALLSRLSAASYVHGVYDGLLKTDGKVLGGNELCFISLKGKEAQKLMLFEKSLEALIKKKRVSGLLLKWGIK